LNVLLTKRGLIKFLGVPLNQTLKNTPLIYIEKYTNAISAYMILVFCLCVAQTHDFVQIRT